MKDERYRAFHLILYLDDERHLKTYDYIVNNLHYASIIHDKDLNDDGTFKKVHRHVVIRFLNAKTITAVSKELDLQSNYIEPCKSNYKKALLYLIHYDEPNKIGYSVDAVEGDLKSVLIKTLQSFDTEDESILKIISILNQLEYTSLNDFVQIICMEGLYSYFRRSQYIFVRLLDEHNSSVV